MATYNLGRILPIFKDQWSSTANYVKLDIVYCDSDSWVATGNSTNSRPSESNTNWVRVAKGGYTPVKGLDYFTAAEISSIEATVKQYADSIYATKTELATIGAKVGDIETKNNTAYNEIFGSVQTIETEVTITYPSAYYNMTSVVVGDTKTPSKLSSDSINALRITVAAGETYKIYGRSKSSAAGLYALYDASGLCTEVVHDSTSNYRENPKTLNITSAGVLYINLTYYDASKDKVTKVTTSAHTSGIKDKVSDIESNLEDMQSDLTDLADIPEQVNTLKTYVISEETVSYNSSTIGLAANKYYNCKALTAGQIGKPSQANSARMDCARVTIPKNMTAYLTNYLFSPSSTAAVFVLRRDSDGMILRKETSNSTEEVIIAANEEDCSLYLNVSNGGDGNADKRPILALTLKKSQPILTKVVENTSRIAALEDGAGNKSWMLGKTLVMVGDSQVGDTGDLDTLVMQRLPLQTALRCGFSGSWMTQRYSSGQLSPYDAYSMHSIALAIATGDFTRQEENLELINSLEKSKYPASVSKLKDLEWGDGDNIILTIQYGGNDWNNNITIGDMDSGLRTVKGATKYVIETLLTALPKLTIIFVGHPYAVTSYEGTTILTDSDTTPNSIGKYRYDYSDAIFEVAKTYHIPVFDMYRRSGRNKFNSFLFASDGKHWHTELGHKRLAELYARILQTF